jgi:hypothetical protein
LFHGKNQKENIIMMPMSPENAKLLAKHHAEDLLREAEADRRYIEARRGLDHPSGRFLAQTRATVAALVHLGRHETQEAITFRESGSAGAVLPAVDPAAS